MGWKDIHQLEDRESVSDLISDAPPSHWTLSCEGGTRGSSVARDSRARAEAARYGRCSRPWSRGPGESAPGRRLRLHFWPFVSARIEQVRRSTAGPAPGRSHWIGRHSAVCFQSQPRSGSTGNLAGTSPPECPSDEQLVENNAGVKGSASSDH